MRGGDRRAAHWDGLTVDGRRSTVARARGGLKFLSPVQALSLWRISSLVIDWTYLIVIVIVMHTLLNNYTAKQLNIFDADRRAAGGPMRGGDRRAAH